MERAILLVALALSFPTMTFALGANSQSCNQLYGLPAGTVAQGVDVSGTMSTDACAAKAYINAMTYNDLSGGRCATPKDRVTGLNDAFAICAANFFKAYQEKYGKLTITTAYRPVDDNACRGGVGGSNHTRGVAIDVNPQDGNYKQLWDFSKANSQFGICFPHQDGGAGTTGYSDRPHMILAGIGGNEAAACARQGIAKPCSAGNFNPTSIRDAASAPAGGQAQTPTSGFSDMLRQYMGGQQPATGAVPAGSAVPASSQPYTASQPTTIATPASSGSTGSTGATTAGGSSVTTAVPATIATGYTAQPTNVSDQLSTSQPTGSSNAYDLLNAIANPTTTIRQATGTPLALNGSLYQTQQLTQTQQVQYDVNGQPIALNSSLSNVSALGPSQQTFTSQDLQYTQAGDYVPPTKTNTSLAVRTLENLKQALLKLLTVLRPFGYVRPVPTEDAVE